MTENNTLSTANIPPPLATDAQTTFASLVREAGLEQDTPRQSFFQAAETLVDWPALYGLLRLSYHHQGGRGRPAFPLETMVRLYLVRHWWQLDDEGASAMAWDCPMVRAFCRIDLLKRLPPSARTIGRFGMLVRDNRANLPAEVNRQLAAHHLGVDLGKLVEPAILRPLW